MTAKEIYEFLVKSGLTPEGACGSMGNFEAESHGLRSNNAEGWSDEQDKRYTAEADAGKNNFIYDGIGYGIAQWTWWGRKKKFYEFVKKLGTSVGDINAQLMFFIKELKEDYPTVWNVLISTRNLYEATSIVCTKYEKPKINNIDERYGYAEDFYKVFANLPVEKEENNVSTYTYEYMMSKWLSFVRSHIGYLEKRTNSQLTDFKANAGSNNWNMFADYIDKNYPKFYNGRKNGYAWCDIHVDYDFIRFFGYENALKLLCQPEQSAGAGCKYSANYYRAKGRFYKSPRLGDQVFFGEYGNEGHTGIVVQVTGNLIRVVEGNTSAGSGVNAEGDGVYEKVYDITTQYIPGYGRPDYESMVGKELPGYSISLGSTPGTPNVPSSTAEEYPTLKYGSEGEAVKRLQRLLIAKGYDLGTSQDDGDFGAKTRAAVIDFQRKNGLTVDGIVGEKTWAALKKEENPKDEEKPADSTGNTSTSEGNSSATTTLKLPVLKKGSKSIYVKILQMMLNQKGYKDSYDRKLVEDGDFGASTYAAVVKLQRAKGITVDGIVGTETWVYVLNP